MKKIISLMQSIGFTQYESQVYLALLQQPSVTGYELAKLSGVPASKIYTILTKLLSKELIQVIDSEPKKYIPLPPDEVLSQLRSDYLGTIDSLEDKLEHLYVEEEFASNHIWNLSGRPLIIHKIMDFIKVSKSQIFLSVWDEELDEIESALKQAHSQGVDLNIVHYGKKSLGYGKEYPHGREHKIRIERGGRRIALISDDKKVILGHFLEDGTSNAAWTTNTGLVLLAKDYIIHDIYQIRVLQKYGDDAMDIFNKS